MINTKGDDTFSISYLQENDVSFIQQLDKKVYNETYLVPAEDTIKRLKKNSKTDIVLFTKDQKQRSLIGYLSLIPIPKAIEKKIIANSVSEEEIESSVLPYLLFTKYTLYLSSIVVDKPTFPRFTAKHFFKLMQKHLVSLKRSGIFIETIIARAVSIQGKKTLQRMSFKEIKKDVFIYKPKKDDSFWFQPKNDLHICFYDILLNQSDKIETPMTNSLERNEWYWDTDT